MAIIFGGHFEKETFSKQTSDNKSSKYISKFLSNTDLQIDFVTPAAVDFDRKLNMFYCIKTIDKCYYNF